MRIRIAIAVLLLLSTCAFAATKQSVKQPPSSTGILIVTPFSFSILGDGISTAFTINPWRIPQGGATALPFLPLVGVSTGGGFCGSALTFTATVSGRQLNITFASAPAAGNFFDCSATLLFHPE